MSVVPAQDRTGDGDASPRGSLFSDLAAALKAYRGSRPLSEQELVRLWNEDALDRDEAAHHWTGFAVWAWSEVLRQRAEQPFRPGGLLDAIGRDPAAYLDWVVRERQLDLLQQLGNAMAAYGQPLPELVAGELPTGEWPHVVHVTAGLRRLWLDRRLDIREPGRLETCAIAAHALSAPDTLWAAIDSVLSHGSRLDPFLLDPAVLLADMLGQHLDHQAKINQRRTRWYDLRAADKAIQSELASGRLGTDTERRLQNARVDTAYLRELVDHQALYEQAGMWQRRVLTSMADVLRAEASRVRKAWMATVAEAEQAVLDAEAVRERELAPHVAAAQRLRVESSTNPWTELRRPDNYRGPAPARGDGLTFNRLCDVEPFPGRSGIITPLVTSGGGPSLTVVPDGKSLDYEHACAIVRTTVLDRLAVAPPRSMTFTWIDPVRQGHSAGPLLELLELDKSMIDGKVWSEPDDITASLRRVTDRIADLHQRCLRDTYQDLDAYNAEAGMLSEPHHVVVVTGFPTGFGEDAVNRLRQILDSGSKVGVSLYLVTTTSAHADVQPGAPTDAGYLMPKFVINGSDGEAWPGFGMFMHHNLAFGHADGTWIDVAPIGRSVPVYTRCTWTPFDDRVARAVVHGYGTASLDAPAVVIDSSRLVVDEAGSASSANSLDIPVGLRGRGTEVAVRLGRGLEQNVLVGGLPGSGKSSLFHTIIVNAIRRYTPDELQLYLLDFKQGVEFQPYANGALPHARVVAVQSEREFGLSVLRGLRQEIDQRAALFRGPQGGGADSLREYRERTGQPMPRVLVVIDEFQVIFAEDDPIAHECAAHLDHVVRQGRAFGVHTVLGTQTLRGQGTLGLLRGTLDQIAVRILLKSSEADARLFLADDNPAGARLVRPGQAIFNVDNGAKEGNVEFQIAFTDDEARDAAVLRARRHADAAGRSMQRPLVFDGTRPVDIREDRAIDALVRRQVRLDARAIRAHVGAAVAIGGSGAVEFRREPGAHLLVSDRDQAAVLGVLVSSLLTMALTSTAPWRATVVDGLGREEPEGEALEAVVGMLPDGAHLHRRKLGKALAELVGEMRARLDRDDYAAPRIVLVLQGVHRMRELADDFNPDGSPQQDLLAILRDGPDVGIHVLAGIDSGESLERRLGGGALGEFGARLVGQCSADSSHRLVGAITASRLKDGSMVLHQPDLDRTETVRPYPQPDLAWCAGVLGRGR